MLATQIACPACHTPLKAAQCLPLGTKVKCRHCGSVYAVSPEPQETIVPRPSETAFAPRSAVALAPAANASPARAASVASRRPVVLYGLVTALVLYLMVGAGLAVCCLVYLRDDPVAGTQPGTDDPEPPGPDGEDHRPPDPDNPEPPPAEAVFTDDS